MTRPAHTLCQLMYSSRLALVGPGNEQDDGPAAVLRILDTARLNNAALSITGALYFDQNYFVQLLEGSRAAVTSMFLRISADPRHECIELLSVRDVESRSFTDWSMGYLAPSARRRGLLLELFDSEGFDPTASTAEAVRELFGRTYQDRLAS